MSTPTSPGLDSGSIQHHTFVHTIGFVKVRIAHDGIVIEPGIRGLNCVHESMRFRESGGRRKSCGAGIDGNIIIYDWADKEKGREV